MDADTQREPVLDDDEAALPPGALRDAFDAQLQAAVRPILGALVGIYAFMVVVNPISVGVLAGHWPLANRALWTGQVAALALYVALWLTVGRRPPSGRRLHALAFGMASLPLVDTLGHLRLIGDPAETMSFVVLMLGVAVIFTSWPWFVAFFALGVAGWAWAAAAALPPDVARNVGFLLVQASVFIGVVFYLRMRTLTRLEGLRWLAERRGARLDAQNQQLLALDRLKSEFVNAVSHDLRTPLTSIKGYAEFLEDGVGGALGPEQLGYVAQIGSGARRLEHLVDDLLDFARIEAGAFRLRRVPGRLGGLVAEIAGSLAIVFDDAGVTLEVAAAAPDPLLPFDPQRIGQVLSNLLANAAKFTPPGGHVAVRLVADAEALRCEVADTGVGIAEADLPRLFQRFSQLHAGREKGGTGLGLAISKSIVEAHGGRIGAESRPGGGSVFWFTLPLEPAQDATFEPAMT